MKIATQKSITSVFFMNRIRCFVLHGFGVVSLILTKLQKSKLRIRATRLSKEDC
ncbi:hypothetical protein BDR05DRAFT_959041 [Suillus weaverae]|nr:hypothetical protein BDR05DRAFT_959041 [Suillus weaverae]